ncbi:MAG: DoxX family protein [Saprospiraceae bacterium]
MNLEKIIYYVATGIASFPIAFGAGMYLTQTANVQAMFESFGYPAYLVIPMAILKTLGLIAIWTRLSDRLKEWAYVGFFINTALATTVHFKAGDGSYLAVISLTFWIISYFLDKRVFGKAMV